MKTMNDLFLHFLQDIYYAEKAFAKSAGKIMKSVENPSPTASATRPRCRLLVPRSRPAPTCRPHRR